METPAPDRAHHPPAEETTTTTTGPRSRIRRPLTSWPHRGTPCARSEEEVHDRELSRKQQEKNIPNDGRCEEDYKGSRCEQFQLQSKFTNAGEAGLIAAVFIISLLILVVLALVIYYVRRMMKAKQQSQQKNQQQYWKVKPRV
ncbi:hypothetical protein F2P81_007004 [Scophthalmus maximus]|uniref:Uncharacterized protein n=1 Tax=Scophthalmus maximus TaxID=52904 RepID=A0A6A4T0Z4_SCOMX|nr:hypothetical protein F2P81_007004 [Scophthalmus maximus]